MGKHRPLKQILAERKAERLIEQAKKSRVKKVKKAKPQPVPWFLRNVKEDLTFLMRS